MKSNSVLTAVAAVLVAGLLLVAAPQSAFAACSDPNFGHCVRDEFSSQSYSLNAGDQNWNANWAENGDDNSASGGAILVTSNALRLTTVFLTNETGRYIERRKTIPAGYTSATLEFVLDENGSSTADVAQLRYSTNGSTGCGTTGYTTVTYNGGSTDGTKTISLGDVAGQTVAVCFRIASDFSALDGDWFSFDNVEIRYSTPLAVDLAGFTAAAAAPEGVTLAWETVSETDNVGFNVYRAEAEAGPWAQINAALIPAAAPGSSEGHAYTWTDATAAAGVAYWYMLEDVASDGTATQHQPVMLAAAPAEPNAVGLAGFDAAAVGPSLAGLAALALAAAGSVALRRRRDGV